MVPLTRRDREQARHRGEILASAAQVFAQKGFHNATMEDIAQRAEFAIGSLYKYFRSKEAIFQAVFEENLNNYINTIVKIAEEPGSFTERFENLLNYYAEFAQKHQPLMRIFHSSADTFDWHKDEVRQAIACHMQRYQSAMLQLMQQGIADGILRDFEPDDLASFFVGTLQGFFMGSLRSETTPDFRAKLPAIRSFLFHGAYAVPTTVSTSGHEARHQPME